MGEKMNRSCPLYVAVAGFILTFLGLIIAWYVFPKLESSLIEQKTAMVDGNPNYEAWKKAPFVFKFKIYLFNVTNPQEFQSGGKAIVKEIGPYVYNEYASKEISSIDSENDTINYFVRKVYHFNEKESGCRSDNDLLTIINIPLVSTAIIVEKLAPAAVTLVNDAVPFLFPGTTTVFTTAKVKDILFDGIKLDCQSPEVEMICGALSAKMPPTLRLAENGQDYLVAIFHHVNGTKDGPYAVKRGIKNPKEKGKILSYKEESIMTKWGGSYCNMFNGTDLTILPTLGEKPARIHVYIRDICRSISTTYEKDTKLFEIKALKYSTTNLTFGKEELTSCFCNSKGGSGSSLPVCSPLGTMDISPCVEAPIIVSYPNFLNGEDSLRDYVQGLQPDENEHSSYFIAEQKTGTPLKVRIRIQTNINMKRVSGMDLLENITEGVFPILWIEEAVDLPDAAAALLKSNLSNLNKLCVLKWSLVALGIVTIFASYGLNIYREKLFCFSGNRQVKLTESIAKFQSNLGGNVLLEPVANFLPKNGNSGLVRRHNQVHNTWQITN